MKLYFKIPQKLKTYFDKEITLYQQAFNDGELQVAWRHLERAHILGQAYPFEHSYAHWLMLRFGIRIKSIKETVGQIPRLLVGGVKSFVGIIPVGNTGGSNVPPLKTMEIPEDLKEILLLHSGL
ncbi:MAG: DUF3703 domain-containing protein [Sporocytophaga sp.]|uniref:DUF3703 domain-containing protein n=1 Tax=Sporocytophaga sp. TaxID=2231183 RepID=UPI001B284B39|nr:DUF3703 domain-containing protein [Sporocytophaga sp.]MBO9701768.1 DUF3703 domain-containing protein [Sporocytophaga sp.]